MQVHDPRKNELSGPDGLLGVVVQNLLRSIVDVLASAKQVTKSEQSLPDGTTGFRLVARNITSARPEATMNYTVAVTLDPAHDFLPCEILVTSPEQQFPMKLRIA